MVDQATICSRWQVPQLAHRAGGPNFAFWENSTRPGQLVVCACSKGKMSSPGEMQYSTSCISQHSSSQMQGVQGIEQHGRPSSSHHTAQNGVQYGDAAPAEGQLGHLQHRCQAVPEILQVELLCPQVQANITPGASNDALQLHQMCLAANRADHCICRAAKV